MIPFSREREEREREIGFLLDSSLRKQRETEGNERGRRKRDGGEFKRGRHASECLSFDVRTA